MRRLASHLRFGVACTTVLVGLGAATSAFAVGAVSPSCQQPAGDVDGSSQTNVADVQCQILGNLWALSGATTGEPPCFRELYPAAPAGTPTGFYQSGTRYITGGDLNCDGNNDVSDVQLAIFFALKQKLSTALDANQDDCVDVCLFDSDDDGLANVQDCAPYDPRQRSGGAEQCDAVDNNCNSQIDTGDPDFLTCSNGVVCDGLETCPVMPTGTSLVITEIMIDPSGTNLGKQWVEIYNPTASNIDLRTWKLLGNNPATEAFTIAGAQPIIIRSGGFAVLISNADFATNGGISGNRFFPMVPYTGIQHTTGGTDAVRLQNPSGVIVDSVQWDTTAPWTTLFTAMEGRSIRFSPGQAQTATSSIATNNDSAANWAQSTLPWQPAGLEGDVTVSASDLGSPGGLWVATQTQPNQLLATRCADGADTTCDGSSLPTCQETDCFEPTAAHPNADFGGPATAAGGEYNPATGCLVYIAATYEDPNNGACDDSRTCTTQACDPDSATADFIDPTTGCAYSDDGVACADDGNQCTSSTTCLTNPNITDVADLGLTSGVDSIGVGTGCILDVLSQQACDDGIDCTWNERCSDAAACDDFGGANAITQAQATQFCVDVDLNDNDCVDSVCTDITGAPGGPGTVACSHTIQAGECRIDISGTNTCFLADATPPGATSANDCLRCNPGVDQTEFTFLDTNPLDATRCFIAGICYAQGDEETPNGCTACQRSGFDETSSTDWSDKDIGTSCSDGLFCTINDACDADGGCTDTDPWETTNCTDEAACASAECDETTTPGTPQCSWTPLAPGAGTECFVGDPLTGSCVADGADDPANFCMECRPAVSADGYSPKDVSGGTLLCDAEATADSPTAGDGNVCTVDACNALGACTFLSAWEDYDDDGDTTQNCPEVTCANDTCDPNGGNPQCRYTHLGLGNTTECLPDDGNCIGGNQCFYAADTAPVCIADGAELTPQGCMHCDVDQDLIGYSPKPALTTCFGGDVCQIYSCGGEVGNEATAGTCIDRADWEDVNCDGLPNAGCNSSNNYSCISDYATLAGFLTDYPDNVPPGNQFYLDESSPLLVAPPDSGTFVQACQLDLTPCGTTCLIGGTLFQRGQINPGNQCEWCNPTLAINSWSARFDDGTGVTNGFAETLTAAQALLTPPQTAAWSFGTPTTIIGEFCRDDIADPASVDGDLCTIQYCQSDSTCGGDKDWIDLQADLLTDIVDNDDPLANCVEHDGNNVALADVSTCADKSCDAGGGSPQCVITANGGDDPGSAPECYIPGEASCIADADRHTGGRQLEQCQYCDAAGAPGEWTLETAGTACNNDDSGCTFGDACSAGGACTAGATLPPTCDPGNGVGGSDGYTCTLEACVDGAGDEYTAYGNPGEEGDDFSCVDATTAPATVALTAGTCFIPVPPAIDPSGLKCYGTGAQQEDFTSPSVTQNAVCSICNPATNSRNWSANAGALCTDGAQCSIADSCTTTVGECRGIEINAVCNDGNPCTIDVCDDDGTGAAALSNPIVSGDDAYPVSTFTGCVYDASATTVACDDGNLCTHSSTCSDPTNAANTASPAGTIGDSRGQCQLSTATPIDCSDNNECTHNYCDELDGACKLVAIPRYFIGEHDTTGLTVPLKLGLTPAQGIDPTFDYRTAAAGAPATQTGIVRRCDLTDWCTAGTCNASGFCIVVDQINKCADGEGSFTDDGDNSCTAPACDRDLGTWSGASFATFTPTLEADAVLPAVDGDTYDSTNGCYLAEIPDNSPCNTAELLANDVCANPTLSVCQNGTCDIEPVVCTDTANTAADQSCRTYECDPAISTPATQCVYKLIPAATCDDNNSCTNTTCVQTAAGQTTNVVACSPSANTNPGTSLTAPCAHPGQCHPVLGWNPAALLVARVDADATWNAYGAEVFGSLAYYDPATVAGVTTAAGSAANDDLANDGSVDGFADAIMCQESPDDPCTGPDYCRGIGTCNTAPVPHCEALNTNTLCVIHGTSGSTVRCPIRLAAGAHDDVVAGDVAYTLQLEMLWSDPGDRVDLLQIVDKLCFLPTFCFEVTVDGVLNNSIYPYGHTAAFNPTTVVGGSPDWNTNDQGSMIVTALTPARLNMAEFVPDFNPATSLESHIQIVDDTFSSVDELDVDAPVLFALEFTLNEDIFPDDPVILYASDILATREDASLVDLDVWNRIIVTKPLTGSAQCDPPTPNGTPCEDGDACTAGDYCQDGACVPGSYIENQQCEDGEQCTYVDTCVIGTCETGNEQPCGEAEANDIACVISGEEDDVVDCWLYLAAEDSGAPLAYGHQFDLQFTAPMTLTGLFDKAGTALAYNGVGGTPGRTLATAPADTHTFVFDDPAFLTSDGATPSTAWTMFILDFTLTNVVTGAYYDTDNAPTGFFGPEDLDGPAGEPMPGAFLRLQFTLTGDIDAATPAYVTYQPQIVPTSALAQELSFTIGDRVILTGDP